MERMHFLLVQILKNNGHTHLHRSRPVLSEPPSMVIYYRCLYHSYIVFIVINCFISYYWRTMGKHQGKQWVNNYRNKRNKTEKHPILYYPCKTDTTPDNTSTTAFSRWCPPLFSVIPSGFDVGYRIVFI